MPQTRLARTGFVLPILRLPCHGISILPQSSQSVKYVIAQFVYALRRVRPASPTLRGASHVDAVGGARSKRDIRVW